MMITQCLITGASQGIGRATAIALSKTNLYDRLLLVARSSEGLDKTMQLCDEKTQTVPLAFDLSKLDEIDAFAEAIYNEYGEMDALLNIAGYADPKPLIDTTAELLKATFTINVYSLVLLTREVAKHMRKKRSGKILNVASTAGSGARPGWLAYASSKAAVISISETLSSELSEYGIQVYCISPGRCATELRAKLAPMEDASTIMQPEAVANAIVSVLHDDGLIDGQNIVVRQQVK
ncbi:MAG: SDR family oxidoreductase [Coriobacteriales bacterium]|jgi:3-oxoacyl-[acyl-carrier protein] reductase|nr:SDR family oxidoreductase [Coriobacteriales bacterium]